MDVHPLRCAPGNRAPRCRPYGPLDAKQLRWLIGRWQRPSRYKESTMDYRKRLIVEPGRKVRLAKIDPSYTGKHESHEKAAPQIRKHLERVGKLQYLLYADGDQSLLVVLQ